MTFPVLVKVQNAVYILVGLRDTVDFLALNFVKASCSFTFSQAESRSLRQVSSCIICYVQGHAAVTRWSATGQCV